MDTRIKNLSKAVYEIYWEHDENGHPIDPYHDNDIDNLLIPKDKP